MWMGRGWETMHMLRLSTDFFIVCSSQSLFLNGFSVKEVVVQVIRLQRQILQIIMGMRSGFIVVYVMLSI